MPTSYRERRGMFAVNLGLVANIGLAGLKTTVGILGHSQALLADGINSVSDVIYYVLVSVFVRLAGQPPDEEHPYGHRQLESVAALIVGAFVLTTAIALFWDAANSVYARFTGAGIPRTASIFTLYVALLTVLLKLGLVVVTRQIGQQTRNAAILALASDHRNDVFSALAVTIGITLGRLGYSWVDPLAGAIVALVIFRTGLDILQEGVSDLMRPLPVAMLRQEITSVTCGVPGVRDVEEIHAHRFGPYLVMNITIGIDGNLTVSQGDAIASAVERAVMEHDEYIRRVHIHYHPVQR